MGIPCDHVVVSANELSFEVPAVQGGAAESFYVVVDGTEELDGIVAECDESNNDALTESAACPIPG